LDSFTSAARRGAGPDQSRAERQAPVTTQRSIALKILAAGAGASALCWAVAGRAPAQTPPPSAADQEKRIEALEAEVRELTAEIRALRAAQGLAQGPSPSPSQSATSSPPIATAHGTQPRATGPRPNPPAVAQTPGQQAVAEEELAQQEMADQAVKKALLALPRVAENDTHRLRLQSPGGYSIAPAGLVQFDAGSYTSFRPDSPVVGPQAFSNGVNARRARIGVIGTTPGDWSFALVFDAGNSQDLTPKGVQTAQIVYGGVRGVAFEIGYSNTFFTLDQATAPSDLLFLERSSPTDIATSFNTDDFRSNVGVRAFGDRYWVGAYLTGPTIGDSHTQTAERFGAFERATFLPIKDKVSSVHLGVGVDQLIQATNNGPGTPNTLTLSDQPELRIDPAVLLNTGAIGSAAHPVTGGVVYDLETAATWTRLFWQGEYYHYQVYRRGLPSTDFDGWYGQFAVALTDDTHTYNVQLGSYNRIYPKYPFNLKQGQLGAFEVAARLSYVNLIDHFTPGVALAANPAAVNGGAQHGLTLGLNWYPNDLIRFMLDYNHISFDKENGTAVPGAQLGAPVGTKFDAVSLRSQFVY
jgi:phosphate-selective porin OprO/OprP